MSLYKVVKKSGGYLLKHMNNKRASIVAVIILILVNICFIWCNSLQTSDTSNAVSDSIAETVKPIVEPIVRPITAEDNTIFGYKYNAFIRKMAHGFEFMLLGALLIVLRKVKQYIFPLYCLSLWQQRLLTKLYRYSMDVQIRSKI